MSGRLIECEPLRFTPAGVPICQGLFEHESTQSEAGHERSVKLTLAIRFVGPLAEQASRESLGCALYLKGFIAPKKMFRDGKPSAAVQMHVLAYQRQDT